MRLLELFGHTVSLVGVLVHLRLQYYRKTIKLYQNFGHKTYKTVAPLMEWF